MKPEILEEIRKQRLLIITPFEKKVKRITSETAQKRNELIAELADEIFVAFAKKGGSIEQLLEKMKNRKKIIKLFNERETGID